jgi:hypothetical protein
VCFFKACPFICLFFYVLITHNTPLIFWCSLVVLIIILNM